MQGWIKLHRKILDNEIWNDPTTFRLFTLLLIKASHMDGYAVGGITLNKGQYIRSYSKLAEDLSFKEGRGLKRVSKSTIKRSIDKLIENNIITVHETEHGTLFTVLKYHLYQGVEGNNETERRTEHGTNMERTQNEVRTKSRIKELKREREEDPFSFYEKNYGRPSSITLQSIGMWVDDTSQELVLEAMREGLKYGAGSFGYCERILRDWDKKGIKDIESLKAFQQKKSSNVTPFVKKKTNDNLTQLDEVFRKMGLRKGEAQ